VLLVREDDEVEVFYEIYGVQQGGTHIKVRVLRSEMDTTKVWSGGLDDEELLNGEEALAARTAATIKLQTAGRTNPPATAGGKSRAHDSPPPATSVRLYIQLKPAAREIKDESIHHTQLIEVAPLVSELATLDLTGTPGAQLRTLLLHVGAEVRTAVRIDGCKHVVSAVNHADVGYAVRRAALNPTRL